MVPKCGVSSWATIQRAMQLGHLVLESARMVAVLRAKKREYIYLSEYMYTYNPTLAAKIIVLENTSFVFALYSADCRKLSSKIDSVIREDFLIKGCSL